jgi:hypothetical protein
MDRDHGEDISNALKVIADAMPDLRDRFAAAALTGYLAAHTGRDIPMPNAQAAAEHCYRYAAAMLAERRRREGAGGA